MEKIGELGPQEAEGRASTGSMKDRIFKLRETLDRAKRNSAGYSESGGWTGPFDRHLHRFLDKLDGLFEWVDSHHPSRREQFGRTLARLDPSGLPLARPLRDRRYRAWNEMSNFFQKISHHRSSSGIDEFRKTIRRLEVFLTNVLLPTTFDDLDAIDALLKESGHAS